MKDQLLRRMFSIAKKIPKSALDELLKKTTMKKGNRRVVRQSMIDILGK